MVETGFATEDRFVVRSKAHSIHRSILTVPWIELGGPVAIECPQTGHKAAIEFITKPFYGGKKHRVTCEIFAGGEKKPYYSAQGEWNSRMDGRWNDTGV